MKVDLSDKLLSAIPKVLKYSDLKVRIDEANEANADERRFLFAHHTARFIEEVHCSMRGVVEPIPVKRTVDSTTLRQAKFFLSDADNRLVPALLTCDDENVDEHVKFYIAWRSKWEQMVNDAQAASSNWRFRDAYVRLYSVPLLREIVDFAMSLRGSLYNCRFEQTFEFLAAAESGQHASKKSCASECT